MPKFICDGHEYTVVETSNAHDTDRDEWRILNNYGTHVATFGRDITDEYWYVTLPDGTGIAQIHEDAINDNALDTWAVQQYVAWAMDNNTVEDHH